MKQVCSLCSYIHSDSVTCMQYSFFANINFQLLLIWCQRNINAWSSPSKFIDLFFFTHGKMSSVPNFDASRSDSCMQVIVIKFLKNLTVRSGIYRSTYDKPHQGSSVMVWLTTLFSFKHPDLCLHSAERCDCRECMKVGTLNLNVFILFSLLKSYNAQYLAFSLMYP